MQKVNLSPFPLIPLKEVDTCLGHHQINKLEDKQLANIKRIISTIKGAFKVQKNISKSVKTSVSHLEEAIDILGSLLQKRTSLETVVLPDQGKKRASLESTRQPSPNPGEQVETPTPVPQEAPTDSLRTVSTTDGLQGELNLEPERESSASGDKEPIKENELRSHPPTGRTPEKATEGSPGEEGAWTVQQSRKRRRNRRRKSPGGGGHPSDTTQKNRKGKRKVRPRPKALLVKVEENKTFAEVLNKIRKNANPEDLQTEINSVRRTRSGDLLLELGKNTKNESGFCEALKGILGPSATVRNLEPKTTIEIRDLDCLTTVEDIKEVLAGLSKEHPIDPRVYVTNENLRGQKMAVVELEARCATEILKTGRLRIGWVNCRVRERIQVRRCYACFGYGHTQKACKGPNRREMKLCLKCGDKDHIKKDCTRKPKCFLCAQSCSDNKELSHIAGSSGCPMYKAALEKARKAHQK